jgi:hypothetical protein
MRIDLAPRAGVESGSAPARAPVVNREFAPGLLQFLMFFSDALQYISKYKLYSKG